MKAVVILILEILLETFIFTFDVIISIIWFDNYFLIAMGAIITAIIMVWIWYDIFHRH